MGRKSLAVILDSIIISLSIALLLGLWGCAHMPKSPSEEMRAQFGTIGIVSAPSNPKIQFHPEFAKGRLSGALRDEIDNCFKELPKQIVEELFEKKSL